MHKMNIALRLRRDADLQGWDARLSSKERILFLCPHNAAKSVIAATYFNLMADTIGLDYIAESGGTQPSDSVMPVVVEMLRREGADVSGFRPRHVTVEQLHSATRIISIGSGGADDFGVDPARMEQWNDIPTVSATPEEARAAIRERVARLVAALRVMT